MKPFKNSLASHLGIGLANNAHFSRRSSSAFNELIPGWGGVEKKLMLQDEAVLPDKR